MIPEGNPKLFGKITCQWYFEKEGCQPKRAGLQPAGRSRPALQEQVVKHSLLNYSTGRRHRVGLPLCTKVCKDQGRKQPIHCTKASHHPQFEPPWPYNPDQPGLELPRKTRTAKKGLRSRNSPYCTLSQNGYGAKVLPIRGFILSFCYLLARL